MSGEVGGASERARGQDIKPEQCMHRIFAIDEKPYRWQCIVCGKKLKIASGIIHTDRR